MKKYSGLFAVFALLFCIVFANKAYSADKVYYYGDANADEAVTADDALIILKDVVRLVPIKQKLEKTLADINRDGEITAQDALETLKIVVKLKESIRYIEENPTEYPGPTPDQTPTQEPSQSPTEKPKTGMIINLSKDSQTVTIDKSGKILGEKCFTTVLSVFLNGKDITNETAWPGFPQEMFDIKYNIHDMFVSGYWDEKTKTYTVTELYAEEGYVDITAIYQGVGKTVRFTVKCEGVVDTEPTSYPTEEPSSIFVYTDKTFENVYVDSKNLIITECKVNVFVEYNGKDISELLSEKSENGPIVEITESDGLHGYWDYETRSYYATSVMVDIAYVDIKVTYKSSWMSARFYVCRLNNPSEEYNNEEVINSLSRIDFESREDKRIYVLVTNDYKCNLKLSLIFSFYDNEGKEILKTNSLEDVVRKNNKCVYSASMPVNENGEISPYSYYTISYNIIECDVPSEFPEVGYKADIKDYETIFKIENNQDYVSPEHTLSVLYYVQQGDIQTLYAVRKVDVKELQPGEIVEFNIKNPLGIEPSFFNFYTN